MPTSAPEDSVARLAALEAELAFREEVIEQIGTGQPLPRILDRLCLALDARLGDAQTGILVHDRNTSELWHVAAPSVPPDLIAVVDGMPVADGSGAGGTAAVRREDYYVADVRDHPYSARARRGLTASGAKAIWSHPLIGASGLVVGVLTVHRLVMGVPTDEQRELLDRYGRLATLALEHAVLGEQIQRLGTVDHPTRLPNRSSFLEMVNKWLADDPADLSVLVMDLTGTGPVVSVRRHLELNAIRAEIASRLTELIGDDGVVASIDAGEFAVAVLAPAREAAALGDRVLHLFDRPIVVDAAVFYVNPAIGISHVGAGADIDAYGLVQNAAAALHAARTEGAGRRRLFDDALSRRIAARLELQTDLRRGIETGEFFLVYQPLFNLATGSFDRLEALVRWQHPTRGLVPPDEFIPVAEQSGLIIPLGGLVFRLAIDQARYWQRHYPDLRIAVNVSAVQLANPSFADEMVALMEAAGVRPDVFSIEITESGLIESLEVARACLERFIGAGIRIAIDDFGTGHSSLARLDEVPASGLKIDKRFVQRLVNDPVTAKVVRAIVDVADAHGLFVVAEGVEDAETLALVEALPCQWVQGYHFSRPVPAAAAEEYLRR